MNARDALEVVRKASWANEEDAHCGCEHYEKKREAIAVLSNLVERAGEPVAWMPIETAPRGQYEQIIAGFAEDEEGYSPDSREMWFSEESQMWKLSSDPNWSDPPQPTHWQPLPTAPGASHER